MDCGIKERVIEWARSGGDFHAGLSLFLTYNRNMFYARNIEAKGAERGMVTLVSEFSNKTRVAAKEILALVEEGRGCFPDGSGQAAALAMTNQSDDGATGRMGDGGADGLLRSTRNDKKLREEFPFLGRKDCPDEFAIVVNKMLTAYDGYRANREKLYDVDANNPEQCYLVAREVLDDYILNRECWEELNYYKIHGKIRGKMPEFKQRGMIDEYSVMSTVNLVKVLKNNIPRKMSYYKQQINDVKTKNKDDIRAKMAVAENELAVIGKILRDRGEI